MSYFQENHKCVRAEPCLDLTGVEAKSSFKNHEKINYTQADVKYLQPFRSTSQ